MATPERPQVVETHVVRELEEAAVVQQLDAAHKYSKHTDLAMVQGIVDDCTAVCTQDYATAEECHYSLPRGGKSIEGPSIHMMRVIKARYGNIAVAARVIEEGDRYVRAQAVVWDMESNVRQSAEARRPIVYGKNAGAKAGQRFDDDLINVTCQAAMAIAERNALQGVIPKSVWGPVYEAVRDRLNQAAGLKDDLGPIRKRMISWYSARGVTEAMVCKKVGKARISALEREDLVTLGGIKTRIDSLETTVEEQFPELAEPPPPEEKKTTKKEASKRPAAKSSSASAEPGLGDAEWDEAWNEAQDLTRSLTDEQRAEAFQKAGVDRLYPKITLAELRAVISAATAHLE